MRRIQGLATLGVRWEFHARQKAVRILFSKYWSTNRWTNRPVSESNFEYAKHAGVMFDPVEWYHDDTVRRVNSRVAEVDRGQVARQFVASLSTQRLDVRSALGSYAAGRYLPPHSHADVEICPYCGRSGGRIRTCEDLNVLNFERFKWGGARHLHPEYEAFDLDCFSRTEPLEPTPDDYAIMRGIVSTIRTMPLSATPNDLQKALGTIVPSNAAERTVLIQILGYCSILETPECPGFHERYITYAERPQYPPNPRSDWQYPAGWWKGNCGLNEQALRFWFPFIEP